MLNYAVQEVGRDFEPLTSWSADSQPAVTAVIANDNYDLLVWDPDEDNCEIYTQQPLATLTDQLDHTVYARLLGKITEVVEHAGYLAPPALRKRWYLASYLASLDHQSPLNTAAALLSLTVQHYKYPKHTDQQQWRTQLRGLADQARCWLLAAHVTPLQLVATTKPLTTLLAFLLDQTDVLDACQAGGRSRAWQLANDADRLSHVTDVDFDPAALQTASAWTLLRAAAFEASVE